MKRFHQRPLRHHQKGAVAIIVGLCIIVLIGFLGLVVDLGRLFITKTELQNAADACALASARELNGQSDALTRADNAGITIGSRNKVNFQGDAIAIQSNFIDYSNELAGPYQTSDLANPITAKYAKCTIPETGITPYFMQILGFGNQTVRAMGVAHLDHGQIGCAIPLGLCKKPGGAEPDFGFVVGKWETSKFPSGPGPKFTGSFDWIDFTPNAPTPGCAGGGANELKCLLEGPGECNIPPAGTLVGEQGQIASLDKSWNSRFGISQGSTPDPTKSDQTGFSYTATTWPYSAPQNAYSRNTGGVPPNYKQAQQGKLSYQTDIDPNQLGAVKTINYNQGVAGRRIAAAPIVDCTDWAASTPQNVPVLGYACILMLHPVKGPHEDIWLEYLGRTNSPNNPCISAGLGGGNGNGPLVPVLAQ